MKSSEEYQQFVSQYFRSLNPPQKTSLTRASYECKQIKHDFLCTLMFTLYSPL